MYEHIKYEVTEPVAIISMNRPEALNAITGRMQAELKHALEAAETDEKVVGIVLTGEGRGFCAGADMGGSILLSVQIMIKIVGHDQEI